MNACDTLWPASRATRSARLGRDFVAVAIMWAIAAALGALLVFYRRAHRPFHPTISLAEMRAHVAANDVPILDARDLRVYATGHIPHAVSLPVADWARRSTELGALLRQNRERLVIVYCSDEWCGQAEKLQLALIEAGHRQVGVFVAGFEAWRAAGLEVAASR